MTANSAEPSDVYDESGSLVSVREVHKSFAAGGDNLPVLRNVSLDVGRGEAIALMGRSGSGKSTLLNLIGLLDQPSSGVVAIDGVDVATLSEPARARLRGSTIGFVFQQFHLIDHRTAWENVAEPLLFASNRDVLARRPRCLELLDRVGLSHRVNAMPHQMSGGEQQRVAIARALARAPKLICADEPTGALDSATGNLVLDLMFELVRTSQTALLVATHDEAVAARADRIVRIQDGKLLGGTAC